MRMRVGNPDLADVVDERGLAQERDVLAAPAELLGELSGDLGDALGVAPRRGVLGVDGAGQRAHPGERLRAAQAIGALRRRELLDDLGGVAPGRVAAVPLRPVERAVGEPDELVGEAALAQVADAERNVVSGAVHLELQPLDQRAHPLGAR